MPLFLHLCNGDTNLPLEVIVGFTKENACEDVGTMPDTGEVLPKWRLLSLSFLSLRARVGVLRRRRIKGLEEPQGIIQSR